MRCCKGPSSFATTTPIWTKSRKSWPEDFSTIFKHRAPDSRTRRPILSPERSLGSVIQLLTPSPQYTDEYNDWLRQLRQTTRQLVFTVKRYYQARVGRQIGANISPSIALTAFWDTNSSSTTRN